MILPKSVKVKIFLQSSGTNKWSNCANKRSDYANKKLSSDNISHFLNLDCFQKTTVAEINVSKLTPDNNEAQSLWSCGESPSFN